MQVSREIIFVVGTIDVVTPELPPDFAATKFSRKVTTSKPTSGVKLTNSIASLHSFVATTTDFTFVDPKISTQGS